MRPGRTLGSPGIPGDSVGLQVPMGHSLHSSQVVLAVRIRVTNPSGLSPNVLVMEPLVPEQPVH